MNVDVNSTLSYQLGRIKVLDDLHSNLGRENVMIDAKVEVQTKNEGMIKLSREFYQRALDLVYSKSVGEFEQLINTALAYVFHDKIYKVKVCLEDRYGKSLEFMILDESKDPPLELSITDGVGHGVRTVVSFIVHVFYLLNKGGTPVLFIDEGYSFIASAYIDRFFSFLRGLAKEKGLIVVMITHDERMIEQADKVYHVADGVVTEEQEKNT